MKKDEYISPSLETSTTPAGQAVPLRKPFDLARLLVLRDRLPWFWFFFTVAVLLLSALDRYRIVSQFKQRERVVIVDPAGTYYVSPLLQFQEAKDLHVQQAELAAQVFLARNPKDFDNLDLLKLMFLKKAFTKAQEQKTSEAAEFRAKQLHQKAEIGRIDILATRENEVLASVTGQLIRSGIFQDKAFTEAFPFTLRLSLLRNPNMALNGRFPTAVGDFKYEINR
ncbi:MAG: hypothetical protein AAB370_12180 [Verrucomicrobiota bacterium]